MDAENQFVAMGTYTDTSTQVLTTTVTWNSVTTAAATTSNAPGTQGLATALAVGTTSITATDPTTSIVSPGITLTVTTATQYAYATNFGGGTVSQYGIGANGALNPMDTPTVTAGTQPFAIVVDATGHYAYVINYGSNNLSQYNIGANGTLTAMGTPTVATGTGPNGIAINGSYVY